MKKLDYLPYYDDYYDKEAIDVCIQNYVRVVCKNEIDCLQIHNDIISKSRTMTSLAGARPADNLSECIYIISDYGTLENMKIICVWFYKHFEYEFNNSSDDDRENFDKYYFLLNKQFVKLLFNNVSEINYESDDHQFTTDDIDNYIYRITTNDKENYVNLDTDETNIFTKPCQNSKFKNNKKSIYNTPQEIINIMKLAIFLELIDTDWHTRKSDDELSNDDDDELSNDDDKIFCKNPVEICCQTISKIINNCSSVIEMQYYFSEIIGGDVLTAKEKAEIIKDDFWIHGDEHVTKLIDILRKEDKEIPIWTIDNSQFLSDVQNISDNKKLIIPPIEENLDLLDGSWNTNYNNQYIYSKKLRDHILIDDYFNDLILTNK